MGIDFNTSPEYIKSQSERFFDEKIETLSVSKEEFLGKVQLKYPQMSNEDVLQMKGINFDQDGKTIILLRTDIFPEEYIPYLETHEKWEAYIARKGGYNFFKKSIREYKENKGFDTLEGEAYKQYLEDLSVYNYDFRHEYGVFKEYQQAQKDGKLEQYHQWIMTMRQKEKETASPQNLEMIENDTSIRESIYKKLTDSQHKHNFLRK